MRTEKKWVVAVAIIVIAVAIASMGAVLLLGNGSEDGGGSAEIGGPAPDFQLTSLEGESHRLSDYQGNVVVLNFVSTACPVCMDEMSHLKGVKEEFGDQVVIMTISVDPSDTTEDMEHFRDSYGGNWIYGMKPSIGTEYYVRITPAVFVVDTEGIITFINYQITEEEELISVIEPLL